MATTQPIRSTNDLDRVRANLTNNRDRALFELGVGTAFRGGDILSLHIEDVQFLRENDQLVIREQKTLRRSSSGKIISKAPRAVRLNSLVANALQALVAERIADGAKPSDWLFVSLSNFSSSNALSTVSLTRLWKQWCEDAGLRGTFGSHTGRKSLGYLSRVEDGIGIEVLQKMYGHASTNVTQAYICVHQDEIDAVHMKARTNR